jgi:hypothetical protein
MKTIYRLLEVGETIQDGDEYLLVYDEGWEVSSQSGEKVRTGIYRRRMNVAELNETLYQKVGHDKGKYSYQPAAHREVPENGGAATRIAELEKENEQLLSQSELDKRYIKKLEGKCAGAVEEIERLRKSQIVWLDETGGSLDERTHFILHRNGRTAIVPLPPSEVDPAEEAFEKWWSEQPARTGKHKSECKEAWLACAKTKEAA